MASGTRQEHIQAKAEVENLLKLEEILIPLQSAHTRSEKDDLEPKKSEDSKDPVYPKEEESNEE